MNGKQIMGWLVGVGLLAVVAFCAWQTVTKMPLTAFDIDQEISDVDIRPDQLPPARDFPMGFVYQPWAWQESAFEDTVARIGRHADLITIFHDVGIPWQAALDETAYPDAQEQQIARELAAVKRIGRCVLVVSFLASDRVQLAQNIGSNGSEPRSGAWAKRQINDAEVNAAFLNYCRHLIDRFQPEGFCYVAEVDSAMTDVQNAQFQNILAMSEVAYTALKQDYPDLPVFAEFNLAESEFMRARSEIFAAMLPWTDVFAVSTYPASYDSIGGNATNVTADWFDQVDQYRGDKPFAVVETAFPAEHFFHPTAGVRIQGHEQRLLIPGGPKSQALYLKTLLEACQKYDAKFVNLWAIRDLDQLFELLAGRHDTYGDPMWRLVQDTGLYNEDGQPRPSLRVWDTWRSVPFKADESQ